MVVTGNNRTMASCIGLLPILAAFVVLLTCQAAWATVAITQISNQTVDENQTLTFMVTATTTNNKNLNFNLGNGPTGATLTVGQPGSGTRSAVFSWTPNDTQAGNYSNVIIRASETGQGGTSASTTFSISVGNVNRPPVLDPISSPVNIIEGQTLSFGITGSDPDGVYDLVNNPNGNNLTFSASNLPDGASFDPVSQGFSWTPNYGQAGNYTVTFTVADDGSPALSATQNVTITVGHTNRPPTLDPIGDRQAWEGKPLTITVTGSDPDGDTLTYSTGMLPAGAQFNSATQTFSWTPTWGQIGSYQVLFKVSDNGATGGNIDLQSASQTITITVSRTKRALAWLNLLIEP